MVKAVLKLSSQERREAILQAVRGVFAEKGFDGTTTRELAEAAGVSEALLFKHFPNKEALFTAMREACCNGRDLDRFERLKGLRPCSSTLVLLVHFLVSRVLPAEGVRDSEKAIIFRLMLRSLAEDGEFTRVLLGRLRTEWVPKVEECLKVAIAAGDVIDSPVRPNLRALLAHHLAFTVAINSLPETPAIDYDATRDELVEQATWFALRGIGLKEEVIQRDYNPGGLALLSD